MLNLLVAMFKGVLLFLIPLFWLSPVAAVLPAAEITSPQTGQVLQGTVNIQGTTSSDGFVSGEVSYAYDQVDNPSWFLLGTLTQPVTNGVLAIWDTSTISDGDYQVRLSVRYSTGEVKEVILRPVLVRNYTPIENTSTPTPITVVLDTATPTPLINSAVFVTPYPENPGTLSDLQLQRSLQTGVILGFLVVTGIGIYAFLHYLKYHR